MSRLEKKFTKKKRRVNHWAKRVNEKSMTLFKSHLVLSIDVVSLMQNHCKKFKIKIFVKEKKKIKRIMMITTENIVRWAKEIDVNKMLSTRKNIKTMKRWLNLLIFQVKIKNSKRILKKNDFWIKEISLNISLHEVSFKIVIHEIKIEEMSKDIEKKRAKALIKINKDIHSKMIIKKVEWFTKNSEQKRYILLIICVVSAEMINKLIDEKICHKINIKTTQFYNLNCKIHQCLKCQDYNYKTYECKNKQRCVYCTLNHCLKHCFHKQTWNIWKCETYQDIHKVFDSQCHKQQIKKERIKRIMKHRSLYHVVQEQRKLKAMMLKIFIKTFINLRSLINNDLKRKQRCSTNESHLLNVIITFKNIILNHLVKKFKNKWVEININHVNFSIIFFWKSYKKSKHITNAQENIKQLWMWTLMFQQKKLWILQYNVYKFREKMMIALLHEKKIKNYDILIFQELWWFDENFRAYCSVTVNFMLKNNKNRICFYINKRIDSNIWHSIWYFKDVNTIMLQTLINDTQMTQKVIHFHEAYNSSLRDHKVNHEKESLSDIKKTLHMLKECILVEDFNLHYFTWEKLFYLRQHLLSNNLIKMITNVNALLMLSQDIITKNYQRFQMTINLIFTTDDIMNQLIRCEINEEMKNFSNHLSIQIIVNLKVCKESARKLRCNWKTMNEKKFINTLKEQMLKSLLNHEMKCWCIDEYTKQLLNALKKIIEIFTFWARSHEMIKAEWTKKCTKIIKSMQ